MHGRATVCLTASAGEAGLMAAELRYGPTPAHVYVVDLACGLEEDWGDDEVGAGVRLDRHNETRHAAVPVED